MSIEQILEEVAHSYPASLIDAQLADIPRIAHNMRLSANGLNPQGLSICDIGGGVGLFSTGCAALGMKVLLIDDFSDPVNEQLGDQALAAHRKYGVDVPRKDAVRLGVSNVGISFDVVTTFDSMEHWRHSPKMLSRQVATELLKPGGRFILGVPNCVNLRKRITVPFGYGKWSSFPDWYEAERFRGHVREPDGSDLRCIARDMGLSNVAIHGRNWQGCTSRFAAVRAITPHVEKLLSIFPSLCADLYLVGTV